LIYLQSADPGDTFSGRAQLLAGSDQAFGGGIAIGGPIGEDGAGFRVSAHHYQSDGFRDNPYLGRDDTNGRDETTFRARLVWQAGDDWSFRLTGILSDIDDGYDAFAIDNSLTVLSDKPGKDAQESIGASLDIDWHGSDSYRVSSVTAFADSRIDFSFDADWGNPGAWAPITYDFVSLNDRRRKTFNQELRITSGEDGRVFGDTTDWLFGLYFNRLAEDLTTINRGEYLDPGPPVFTFSLDDPPFDSDFTASSVAVFGQLEFSVSDTGKLSVGARVEQRTVGYVDSNGLDLGPGETMLGGEISYTHRFAADTSGFLTLSRGYKAGGFNLGVVPAGRRKFGEESLWNLEAGVRSGLAHDSVQLSGSVFYNLRRDQQVETSFQLNPNDPASFVFFTDNAARGRTIGMEASLQWFATDTLELYANLGFLDAEFDKFVTPQVDASGRDQAHAPNYSFSLGGVYRHESGWFARVDINGKDAYFFDVSHDQRSKAYSVTKLRLGFEADHWSAQLWLRNAFDKHYAVRGFFFGNEPPLFPPKLYIRQGDPRQLGITFETRF